MVHITFIYRTMLVDVMSIVFVYQQNVFFKKKTPIVSHYIEDCILVRKKTKIKVIRHLLHKHTIISSTIKEQQKLGRKSYLASLVFHSKKVYSHGNYLLEKGENQTVIIQGLYETKVVIDRKSTERNHNDITYISVYIILHYYLGNETFSQKLFLYEMFCKVLRKVLWL